MAENLDTIVLIPHYNNIDGLKKSLLSIYSSIIPIDVLVVDDGSTVPVEEERLKEIYPLTKVLYSQVNEGIEKALNRGLKYIFNCNRYKYIARLDAEDICTADRFVKQRRFLEDNSGIFLIGSWALFLDRSGKPLWKYCPKTEHKDIQKRMFVNNMFCHPTVMCRLEMFKEVGFYPLEYPSAEDFALFFKVTRRFKTANIPEYLLQTFVTSDGISLSCRNRQLRSKIRVIIDNFDFSFWAFYGLIRNLILYCIPVPLLQKLKCWILRPEQ